MKDKDTADIVGGLALTALGLLAAIYAQRYELGDLGHMGPGYFPVVLGFILAILGLLVALPALFRGGQRVHGEWKSLALVVGSIVLFALTLDVLGLVLATVLSVLVSSLADKQITWQGRGALCLSLAALTYLVFGVALGMSLPVWPWSV